MKRLSKFILTCEVLCLQVLFRCNIKTCVSNLNLDVLVVNFVLKSQLMENDKSLRESGINNVTRLCLWAEMVYT